MELSIYGFLVGNLSGLTVGFLLYCFYMNWATDQTKAAWVEDQILEASRKVNDHLDKLGKD